MTNTVPALGFSLPRANYSICRPYIIYIFLFINNTAPKITKKFAALYGRIGLHIPSASLAYIEVYDIPIFLHYDSPDKLASFFLPNFGYIIFTGYA